MNGKVNQVLLVCAVIALCVISYKRHDAKPQAHPVSDGACTPEAIKQIRDITERAVFSAQCAKRDK